MPAARPSTRPRIPFRWRVRGCLKVNNSRGVPRPSMLLSSSIFFIPREGSTFRGTKAERVAEGGPQSRIKAARSGSNRPFPAGGAGDAMSARIPRSFQRGKMRKEAREGFWGEAGALETPQTRGRRCPPPLGTPQATARPKRPRRFQMVAFKSRLEEEGNGTSLSLPSRSQKPACGPMRDRGLVGGLCFIS